VDVAKTTVESPYYTTDQVSALTLVPVGTLRQWRHHGERGPRSVRIGGRVRYRKVDVEAWLREQERASAVGGSS
jgi:excisionase family DNA binding protein